jgi:aspartyl/asparaginyl beta-hydroxylase (cupin superfamily)
MAKRDRGNFSDFYYPTPKKLASKRRKIVRQLTPLIDGIDTNPELRRIRSMLEIWCGERKPSPHSRQRPMGFYIPDLPSAPWLPVRQFPFVPMLEKSANTLRRELSVYLKHHKFKPYLGPESPEWAKGWRSVLLCANNRKTIRSYQLPASMKLLDRIREQNGWVQEFVFLQLSPGERLPVHVDAHNYFATVHLGIHVGPGAGMRAGSASKWLQEGKCVAFDNSFFHTAWNEGDQERVVLAAHLFHPALTSLERQVLRVLHPAIGGIG